MKKTARSILADLNRAINAGKPTRTIEKIRTELLEHTRKQIRRNGATVSVAFEIRESTGWPF